MLMNRAEKVLLNNPARRALQRHYEAPLLTRLGADLSGARVLEVGCGEGAGAQMLLTCLGAAHVTAIDLDPAQIARATRMLFEHPKEEELQRHGLVVGCRHTQRLFGDFVIGVATRS
jgi:spermidine synthase